MRRPLTLRTRLLAVFVACLVPMLLLIAGLALAQRAALDEGARRDATREAALLAAELTRMVDGVEQLLHAVAVSSNARLVDSPACDHYLAELQTAAHGSAALGIADASGRVTCLGRRVSMQQLDAHDRYYFAETLRRNAPVTGEYSLGKAAGARAVHFGYPVRDAQGHAVGVAFAPLNLDWLARQLLDRRQSREGSVTVADRNGTVLVQLPQSRLVGQVLPAAWRGLVQSGAPGTVKLADPVDGLPQVVSYVPLGHGPSGLFVAVGMPADAGVAMTSSYAVLATGLLAALLALGVAGWFVQRHVHRPMRLLQARADERDQAERLMRAARDRAEASSRSLGVLLAEAGHDLRQPIQSMVLSAALLAHKLKGRPEEPAVRRLQRSARHLVDMIDGLLSVSQLDAGRVVLDLQPIALADLLQSVTDEFAEAAATAHVALHCEPTALWTRSDPALLRRVVGNCLSNALKYTPSGGRVALACRACADGEIELSVSDNGIGIAPEHQAAVWEPFRQLQNPERDPAKGLGLGLAIVHRIATLLGHRVDLRSELGRGTTVSVRLPRADADGRHAPDDAVERLHGRLLLVDDDDAVSTSTADLLRELGLEVTACASAERALALLHDPRILRFDAVLAEHRLPAQSGLEVVRAARRLWPDVTAVLMSGGLPAARAEECAAEDIDVLVKPFGVRVLLDALAAHRKATPGIGTRPAGA